jgi:hypothetical protein
MSKLIGDIHDGNGPTVLVPESRERQETTSYDIGSYFGDEQKLGPDLHRREGSLRLLNGSERPPAKLSSGVCGWLSEERPLHPSPAMPDIAAYLKELLSPSCQHCPRHNTAGMALGSDRHRQRLTSEATPVACSLGWSNWLAETRSKACARV